MIVDLDMMTMHTTHPVPSNVGSHVPALARLYRKINGGARWTGSETYLKTLRCEASHYVSFPRPNLP